MHDSEREGPHQEEGHVKTDLQIGRNIKPQPLNRKKDDNREGLILLGYTRKRILRKEMKARGEIRLHMKRERGRESL